MKVLSHLKDSALSDGIRTALLAFDFVSAKEFARELDLRGLDYMHKGLDRPIWMDGQGLICPSCFARVELAPAVEKALMEYGGNICCPDGHRIHFRTSQKGAA